MRDIAAAELVAASVWLRAGAFLIDSAIVALVNLGVASVLGGGESQALLAVLMGVGAAYHIVFVAARSATPGKMAMRITICDPQGRPVQPDTAILRYVVLLVGNIIVAGLVVSLVLALRDPQRRTLHDRIAGTRVVRAPQSAAIR
jgi:uncharacterized RDD family membrane protein YckC